jgi:multiple sugar transport system ATP-binding protein
MNLARARVVDGALHLDGTRIGDAQLAGSCSEPMVGLRPEALHLRRDGEGSPSLRYAVDVVEPMGHEVVVHGRLANANGTEMVTRLDARDEPRPGDMLELTFDAGDLHLFDPESGNRLGS